MRRLGYPSSGLDYQLLSRCESYSHELGLCVRQSRPTHGKATIFVTYRDKLSRIARYVAEDNKRKPAPTQAPSGANTGACGNREHE